MVCFSGCLMAEKTHKNNMKHEKNNYVVNYNANIIG